MVWRNRPWITGAGLPAGFAAVSGMATLLSAWFGRNHHVIDADVAGASPAVGQGIIDDARDVADAEAVPAQALGQLRGVQESAPVMRAARQPAQHIFRADDGEREGFERAVERRRDEAAAGLEQPRHGAEEEIAVGDV